MLSDRAMLGDTTVYFNNFSGTRPILDLKVWLDRACYGLKLYRRGNPLGVAPGA